MSEEILCSFCGNMVDEDAVKCNKCGELFREPELKEIKFKELVPFAVIDVITFGFFSTLWFFINGKAINRLSDGKKDCIKLKWLYLLLAVNGGFYLFYFYYNKAILASITVVQCLIYVALSYRVLRIIQKYTAKVYDAELFFNPFYVIFFNVFYIVHFIETYPFRVKKNYANFDWKSPHGVLLITILIIILAFVRFYSALNFQLND